MCIPSAYAQRDWLHLFGFVVRLWVFSLLTFVDLTCSLVQIQSVVAHDRVNLFLCLAVAFVAMALLQSICYTDAVLYLNVFRDDSAV